MSTGITLPSAVATTAATSAGSSSVSSAGVPATTWRNALYKSGQARSAGIDDAGVF